MKQRASNIYLVILQYGVAAILIIAPFYTTLSIWMASRLRHLDFLKIWKEIVLTALVAIILTFLLTHRQFTKTILKSKLLIVMMVYGLLVVWIGAVNLLTKSVNDKAVIFGWLVDLRIIGIFLVSLMTFSISKSIGLRTISWRKVVLIPAVLVILFGFLQATVLAPDFLRHFGYNASTTLPYETVDNRPDIVRIQSTLRGPNPLGAYLIIIITMVTSMLFLYKNKTQKALLSIFGVICLLVLYRTYSRGAEVGLVLSLLTYLFIKKRQMLVKHSAKLVIVALALVGIATFAVSRHNYLAQNLLFHSSNQSSSSVSSNNQHVDAAKSAIADIVHHPLGGGIGSAGPASRRNSGEQVKIAENYYLQIGQEIGVVGMALFITINILVAIKLWRNRSDELSAILLASLVGLSFINMLSHGWADDTLAYLWWGLAGIALAPAILADRRNRNVKTQKAT